MALPWLRQDVHAHGRHHIPGTQAPVSERCEFLVQTFSFESMNGLIREECRPKTTLPYWIAKLF